MDSVTENVIEWIRGQQTATLYPHKRPSCNESKEISRTAPRRMSNHCTE